MLAFQNSDQPIDPRQQPRHVLRAPPEDPHVEQRVAEIAGDIAADAEDERPGQHHGE